MNAKIIIIDRIIRLGLSFFTGVIAARQYGAEGYGDLSFSLALSAVLSTLCLLGVESIVVREVSRNKKKANEIIGALQTLFLITSVIIFFISTAVLNVIKSDDSKLIITIIVLTSLFSSVLYPSILLAQSYSKFLLIAISSIITNVVVGFLRMGILACDIPINYYALTYPLELFINYLIVYINVFRPTRIKFNLNFIVLSEEKIFSNGSKLLFSALIMILITKIDQIVIGLYLESTSLGIYAVASRIVDAALTVPFAYLTLNSTQLYEAHSNNKKEYLKLLSKLSRFCFAYSFVFIVFINLFGEYIVKTIFGNEYAQSSLILRIISFNVLFLSYGQLLHYTAISEGQETYIMKKIVITFPVYLIILFISVSNFGVIGAGFAYVFMYLFSAIILTLAFKAQRWQIFHLITSLFSTADTK